MVHEGTHKATGRRWINNQLTIRSVAKRGQSTPVIEGARLMVCNGDPHKVHIQGVVIHAEQNDYAVDISGAGMEIELDGCEVRGGWHGISVRSAAVATLIGTKVTDNLWNGISATGAKTELHLQEGSIVSNNGRCGVSVS